MTEIKPEINHQFVPLTREEIMEAYTSGATVTGFVESIKTSKELVEVLLGNGIMATLPFSEVTMYPLRFSKKRNSTIPTNIRCLSMRKIRVKITEVDGDSITVSRKKNMLEAYNKLLTHKRASMYVTEVIEKSAFGDIGEGVTGKLLINEVCRTHIHHVKERITIGQTIDVVLMDADDEQRFAVSYRQAFKPYNKKDYPIGMVVKAKVGDWIRITDTSCYYVDIAPQVPGIMTIREHKHLEYGCDIECTVTGANDKGLYLELYREL